MRRVGGALDTGPSGPRGSTDQPIPPLGIELDCSAPPAAPRKAPSARSSMPQSCPPMAGESRRRWAGAA